MNITRDNYESFFLDYLEGNLEESRIDQFLDFLNQNPDLKEELHLFETIHLPEEPVVFKGKHKLYKTAGTEHEAFELKAVAYMEGDLKDKEGEAFKASLVRNPEMQKEYALFEKTRLVANPQIHFAGKEKLYRTSGSLVWINWLGRAAAVLVFLCGIYSLMQNGHEINVPDQSGKMAALKTPVQTAPKTTEHKTPSEPSQAREVIAPPKESAISYRSSVAKAKQAPVSSENIPVTGHKDIIREGIAPVRPIIAHLENQPLEKTLLASPTETTAGKSKESPNVITLDEYLARKAKKVSNEGVLSANRILRLGLNVASGISGERLGYSVKNGKVSSVGFESKLLAFSIPLEKK